MLLDLSQWNSVGQKVQQLPDYISLTPMPFYHTFQIKPFHLHHFTYTIPPTLFRKDHSTYTVPLTQFHHHCSTNIFPTTPFHQQPSTSTLLPIPYQFPHHCFINTCSPKPFHQYSPTIIVPPTQITNTVQPSQFPHCSSTNTVSWT